MNRIMVFGRPGSGKSTFAIKLAAVLDLPVHHLDRHFYVENWVERDYQEFLAIQHEFVSGEKWVIDGNSMRSLEMRFARADTAIYFRLNPLVCIWRMIKRIFHKNWHIPDLAEGCTKSIRWKLVKYMLNFDRRFGPKIDDLRLRYPAVRFYLVKTDGDARSLLEEWREKRGH